jgi:hypothetical protein
MRHRLIVPVLGLAWLGVLGAGEWRLLHYELSPGEPAASTPTWPLDTHLSRAPGVFQLLVFAHPQCPCTRATIAELAVLMARCSNRLAATVLFVKPAHMPEEWTATDLCRAAAVIPGVTTVCDDAGVEATRFGARTSGQVLLYDPDGRLRFRGGITPSRGHCGASAGQQAVCSIVLEGAAGSADTSVFGCSLEDSGSPTEGGLPSNR